MTDDEIFKMVCGPLFDYYRRDETCYRIGAIRGRLTSTLTFGGIEVAKITMPETKEKIVQAVRERYKIGGLVKFRGIVQEIPMPFYEYPDNKFRLEKAVYALQRAAY